MSDHESFPIAGIMGAPVMHSRSPAIHGHWIAEHGLQAAYLPLPITPNHLEKALRALPALGFRGCNLTIPHKVAALAVMDRLSPQARAIGAMNCVVVEADGSLSGYNYDGLGFAESLREAEPQFTAASGPAVVLGAGGAARAIIATLIAEGAPLIRLVNRTRKAAEALVAGLEGKFDICDWEQRHDVLAGAALVVNTTSLGMVGEPPLDLRLDALEATALVCDAVYVPLETPLLKAARARGNKGVDGLGMLLHQAPPAFHHWFGIKPQVTPQLRKRIEATL